MDRRTALARMSAAVAGAAWPAGLDAPARDRSRPPAEYRDRDENTMLIMRGPVAEVVGTGYVTVIDIARDRTKPYLRMGPGTRRDLSK